MNYSTLEITNTAPLQVADLTAHAATTPSQQAVVEEALAAAIAFIESSLGHSLNSRVRQATADSFPGGAQSLEIFERASELRSVAYTDAAGSEQTLASAEVSLIAGAGYAALTPATAWPDGASAIRITYLSPAPRQAIQAIKMLASYWIEQREAASDRTVSNVPHAVDALILQLRGVMVQ